jgi:hypothetical protein
VAARHENLAQRGATLLPRDCQDRIARQKSALQEICNDAGQLFFALVELNGVIVRTGKGIEGFAGSTGLVRSCTHAHRDRRFSSFVSAVARILFEPDSTVRPVRAVLKLLLLRQTREGRVGLASNTNASENSGKTPGEAIR